VQRVFAAELAMLVSFQSVGVVFFAFHSVVVPLLAFRAGQRYPYSHFFIGTSVNFKFSRVTSPGIVPSSNKRGTKKNPRAFRGKRNYTILFPICQYQNYNISRQTHE